MLSVGDGGRPLRTEADRAAGIAPVDTAVSSPSRQVYTAEVLELYGYQLEAIDDADSGGNIAR